MTMPEIYDDRDSCGFVTPTMSFYYGSREVDSESEEWQFVVRKNGKIIFSRINSELLVVANGESPKDLLIAGMSLFHSR